MALLLEPNDDLLLEDGSGLLLEDGDGGGGGSSFTFFSPPVVHDVPTVLPPGDPEQTGPAYRLFRYYQPRPRGLNVYIYAAGSPIAVAEGGQVSETDPYAVYDSRGVAISDGWEDVEAVFWGGHRAVHVTPEQGALLVAAGYTLTGPPEEGSDVDAFSFLLSDGSPLLVSDGTFLVVEGA